MLEKTKTKGKEAGDGPFFKKSTFQRLEKAKLRSRPAAHHGAMDYTVKGRYTKVWPTMLVMPSLKMIVKYAETFSKIFSWIVLWRCRRVIEGFCIGIVSVRILLNSTSFF